MAIFFVECFSKCNSVKKTDVVTCYHYAFEPVDQHFLSDTKFDNYSDVLFEFRCCLITFVFMNILQWVIV